MSVASNSNPCSHPAHTRRSRRSGATQRAALGTPVHAWRLGAGQAPASARCSAPSLRTPRCTSSHNCAHACQTTARSQPHRRAHLCLLPPQQSLPFRSLNVRQLRPSDASACALPR
jgi:hypothetical protein